MIAVVYLALFIGLALSRTNYNVQNKEKVKLTEVGALTFYQGQYTKARRVEPILQLNCVAGQCEDQFQPPAIQCYNVGFDGSEVQWRCEAELDERVKLGRVQVNCEGYHSPEDEFVLNGSCALEYELLDRGHANDQFKRGMPKRNDDSENDSSLGVLVFIVLLFCCFCYCCCCGRKTQRNNNGEDAPPPAYSDDGVPYQQPNYGIHPPNEPHPDFPDGMPPTTETVYPISSFQDEYQDNDNSSMMSHTATAIGAGTAGFVMGQSVSNDHSSTTHRRSNTTKKSVGFGGTTKR